MFNFWPVALNLISMTLITFIIHLILKYNHPFLRSLSSTGFGVLTLIMLNYSEPLTSIKMPLNNISLGISALLGIPGISALSILNTLFS